MKCCDRKVSPLPTHAARCPGKEASKYDRQGKDLKDRSAHVHMKYLRHQKIRGEEKNCRYGSARKYMGQKILIAEHAGTLRLSF